MIQDKLGLFDLVNLEDWQRFQDSFADVQEITVRTISPTGTYLSKESRPSRVCSDILSKLPGNNKLCAGCFASGKASANLLSMAKDSGFSCAFGLETFIAPVMTVGSRVVAYVVLGPVILKARRDKAEYVKEAESFGIKPDSLIDALIEVNVFSYSKIRSIVKLVREVSSHMAQTGYHKKRLGEIAPEIAKLDPIFSRYYEEKILNALLHACALALNADSGSIMTVDKDTNILHIKVSSKLDENIVNNTNIKMGEGIAGLAAATSETIILPKDMQDKHLSDKMKRAYIKSSMVVPFKKGGAQEVYGVINLNIVRKSVDFTEKDIAIVKELVNLASVALLPLQHSTKK